MTSSQSSNQDLCPELLCPSVNEDIDDVEHPADVMRTSSEVATRCVVLLAVVAAGHGLPRNEIAAWLRLQNIWSEVSTKEADFFLCDFPTQKQLVNAIVN